MASHPVINFRTVQSAEQHYEQQNGYRRKLLPRNPTLFGEIELQNTEPVYPKLDAYPNETALARARRVGKVDVWTPVTVFTMTANKSRKFKGEKAKQMWKAWQQFIFKQ